MAGNSSYQVKGDDFAGACYRPNRILQDVNGRLAALEAAESSASLSHLSANSNADLTLTLSAAPIPGAAVIAAKTGVYLVIGTFTFAEAGAGDVGQVFVGTLKVGSVTYQPQAGWIPEAAGALVTVMQQWIVAVTQANTTLQLQANKQGGAGTSTANHPHCVITAIRVADI